MSKSFVGSLLCHVVPVLFVIVDAFELNETDSSAVDLHMRIDADVRNDVTYICVLKMCSHLGRLSMAQSIFYDISSKTPKITTATIGPSHFCLQINRFSLFRSMM